MPFAPPVGGDPVPADVEAIKASWRCCSWFCVVLRFLSSAVTLLTSVWRNAMMSSVDGGFGGGGILTFFPLSDLLSSSSEDVLILAEQSCSCFLFLHFSSSYKSLRGFTSLFEVSQVSSRFGSPRLSRSGLTTYRVIFSGNTWSDTSPRKNDKNDAATKFNEMWQRRIPKFSKRVFILVRSCQRIKIKCLIR